MTYIQDRLTNRPINLPAELAGFGEYNAAVVAWRFAKRGRDRVPIERWVEEAKRCADGPRCDASGTPDSGLTLMGVLDRLGITKKA